MSMNALVLENYDDLLMAVKETPRGRAFLDEFTQRTRRNETQVVLTAIQKIETVIAEVGHSAQFSPALNDARQSISSIRKEIANLADAGNAPGISLGDRIAAALKLVDDLDHRIQASKSAPTQPAPLTQYFTKDADIFVSEPVQKNVAPIVFEKPAPKPFVVPTAQSAPVTPDIEPKRGATLTISRNKPAAIVTEIATSAVEIALIEKIDDVAEIEVVAAIAAPEIVETIAVAPEKIVVSVMPETIKIEPMAEDLPPKRVVIIRRAASEAAEIPFIDDEKKVTAA